MLVSSITSFHSAILANIHAKCFEKPWQEKDFQALLALPTTFGFLTEKGFLLACNNSFEIEILTICTLPAFQRQGVASFLLNQLNNYALHNHIDSIFLEVNENNLAAFHLYQKNGFLKIATRKNYYSTPFGPQNALILKKSF